MSETQRILGILAEFDGPGALVRAAEATRDAGYQQFDCHSPYPIHGMDSAMGLKHSILGFVVGACGFLGASGAMLLQWWTSAIDYPLVISGKPLFSLPAFIPVTFELTILLSAFGAVFGMLHLNRLPRLFHAVFYADRFAAATDDGFFLSVEAKDANFDAEKTANFFRELGAKSVELIRA